MRGASGKKIGLKRTRPRGKEAWIVSKLEKRLYEKKVAAIVFSKECRLKTAQHLICNSKFGAMKNWKLLQQL